MISLPYNRKQKHGFVQIHSPKSEGEELASANKAPLLYTDKTKYKNHLPEMTRRVIFYMEGRKLCLQKYFQKLLR